MQTVLSREEIYSRNPDIMHGVTVFTGTRVPIQALIDHLAAGDSLNDFLEGFPSVSREQAQGLLELAAQALLGNGGGDNARAA